MKRLVGEAGRRVLTKAYVQVGLNARDRTVNAPKSTLRS